MGHTGRLLIQPPGTAGKNRKNPAEFGLEGAQTQTENGEQNKNGASHTPQFQSSIRH
jgi:hypothetical protein